ncbi:hypothetical protein ABZ371_26555 [Streptomyces sp. NPDC005899]|uniref:hypothetical protein n=1 Tax=Streptomyces sp. NPDC005899 TaxID=3155716 RepID=UPI0033E775BF
MSNWELADLLGVHEHDIPLDHLPNQPLHVVLELARRLDLHPADLTPYAAEVYNHPLHFDAQFPTDPAPGTDTDAIALLNALAHAGRPLTADFLAESLGWNLDRVSDAVERSWTYPHLARPYALRRTAPAHFTLSPSLDVLTERQMNWFYPANHSEPWRKPRDAHYPPLQRDVLSDQDAAVLFQAFYGAVSTDPEEPTSATVAGLLDAGLLARADDGTAVLADVRHSAPPHRRRRRQHLLTHLMAEPLTSSGRLR